MRVADAFHVHHGDEQQLVLMSHLLGEALDRATVIFPLQAVNDVTGKRHRFGNCHRLLALLILPLVTHLHKKQRVHHQQHRSNNGRHHQREGGAEFQRYPLFGHGGSPNGRIRILAGNGARGSDRQQVITCCRRGRDYFNYKSRDQG
ncbi:hypothetical protein D3C72_1716320 [compost metagenome]